jgi:RNA polymerase sigma factor (sigma-70 family)
MEETCRTLAAALEAVVWSMPAEQLAASEPVVRALIEAAGCDLADVLAEMPDESLALAVQKDFLRKPAFEEWLVNRYERDLLRWFYRRTGSMDRAQDLTQELYLKLLTRSALANYNPECLFRPWLWAVVHNLWVGHLRRRRTQVALPDEDFLPASGAAPAEEAACRETEHRLEAAVRELPAVQQYVLREAMSGSNADRMAQDLGLPKQRVFQLLFRARRAIERALGLGPGGSTRRQETQPETRTPLERTTPI